MKKIRQLDMELAGGCNYSCQMCPQSSGREKEFKKLLKWDNFVKIVDNAIEHEVETISLHGGGEPTLNKKFNSGNAVAVSGVVEIFLDQPQLIIKKINKATVQHYSRYGFDPSLVVPSSKKNQKKMWNDLEIIINKIKNTYLITHRGQNFLSLQSFKPCDRYCKYY